MDNILDKLAIEAGFESLAEFNSLVVKVDISSYEKLKHFEEWKLVDGTKEGLLKLIEAKG